MTADDAVVCEVLVDDDERADGDSLRKLEALVDDLTVSSSASHRGGADADDAAASARRRANLILLCRRVASDARAAVFARAHGAEPVLLCALNRAIRDGDDALAELVGDAVAASAKEDDAPPPKPKPKASPLPIAMFSPTEVVEKEEKGGGDDDGGGV